MIALGGIKGLEDAKAIFQKLPVEIARKALRGAMMDGAEIIRAEAKRLAPIRGWWPPLKRRGKVILPGKLRASIVKRMRSRPRQNDMTVSVGWTKDAFYGSFLEYGSTKHSAKPFMRPAFDAKGSDAVKRIAARLGPQINNILKRMARRKKR